ncbi:hypothetical protein [Ralstonia sp.]|uniref:hypothetical protein n=1 Tax=Ralstonia sp. TaxID=54061 RepID=UPI00257A2F9F|nr:hypothetical protein [Ralstonia sp.]MBA4282217.1 hypothetical protein [Ralstonia sp.]
MIESSHWYDRAGAPAYEVRGAGGFPRPTTLRDARKLALVPSVTTVLSVIAKPQLTAWQVRQGILAALTLPRVEGETEDAYLGRIKHDGEQQVRDAAEEGNRIHDAIECAFKGRTYPAAYRPHVEAAQRALAEAFPDVTDWIAEASFAHVSGYGGKVDLHSPSTGIVVDWKGKDGSLDDGKKLAYDQHWQLAAYQDGLLLPRNVCANGFVSRTHPGKVVLHTWTREEIEQGSDVFHRALALWKAMKGFDPSFSANSIAA